MILRARAPANAPFHGVSQINQFVTPVTSRGAWAAAWLPWKRGWHADGSA
jgi:hypothetical protein